jgi:general secretion pathway protein K
MRRGSRLLPKRERGIAAIVAILVVALATSAAAYMLWAQSLGLRYVENLQTRAQADELARAGAVLAGGILRDDRDADRRNYAGKNVDHLGEPWAMVIPPFPAESATLQGRIEDEQGRFNLNNLALATATPPAGGGTGGAPAPATAGSGTGTGTGAGTGTGGGTGGLGAGALYQAGFRNLLKRLQLNEELADALVDWIDEDDQAAGPGGAEDLYYLQLDPPYRAANQRLSDVSELKRVKGFTPEVLEKLAPHVTALPANNVKINVNTASEEVLAAMLDIPEGQARQIVEQRKREPFTDQAKLKDLLGEQGAARAAQMVDFSSNWFTARATVVQGRVTVAYRALLDRSDPRWPRIIALYGEPL